jgi:ATP-binding cassette subfamily B (MDR/TAP) protein 1
VDGVDIRDLHIHWLRSHVGLISQEPVLFNMTIAEIIAYAKDNVPLKEIIDAAKKANIHQFIEQLPLVSERMVFDVYFCSCISIGL